MSNYTETLTHSPNYLIRATKQSKLIPELTVDAPEKYKTKCPRCSTLTPALGHGKKAVCDKCQLQMQVFGNALIISERS